MRVCYDFTTINYYYPIHLEISSADKISSHMRGASLLRTEYTRCIDKVVKINVREVLAREG